MKSAAVLILALLLAACASAPPMPPPASLFHDDAFEPASAPIDAGAALAMSPPMRRYLHERILGGARGEDRKRRLIDALYHKDALMLEYDAAVTRTAAEAFDARSGNCLALVLMTAAFAKEMGLTVRFQSFSGDDAWDRAGDLYVSVGHVNLVLSDLPIQGGGNFAFTTQLTVDFVAPPRDGRVPRTRVIGENTIVAMYLNNRAVESLTAGRVDDAYWFAREALQRDPHLVSAYLTLGVVYRTRQQPGWAETALQRVLEREPDNVKAMSNRVLVLRDLNRGAEAAVLQVRLDALDPHPPFSYFHAGMAALQQHRLTAARSLFEKEVARAPYHHEFQFWLAITYLELHDGERAKAHMARAMEVATTRRDHDLYAAKLARLKALNLQ